MRYLVLIGALCCATVRIASADGNTGLIYGTVYKAGTNQPLCAVPVIVSNDREPPQKTFTAADGSYHFLSVSPGRVKLLIGPLNEVRDVSVSANLETYVQPMYLRAVVTQTSIVVLGGNAKSCARRAR